MTAVFWVLAGVAVFVVINRLTAMPAARGVRVSQILDEARVIAAGGHVDRRPVETATRSHW
jgi:hypothetical protein